MQLNLTSLKYKEKASLDSGNIDWRRICKEDEQRKLYNKYLLELTSRNMTYNTFCEAVVRAGDGAVGGGGTGRFEATAFPTS